MNRVVLAAGALALTGCVVDRVVDTGIKAVDGVPRAIGEASRTHSVSAWTGSYSFLECRPNAPDICFTYEIVVDSSGDATVRADGADLAIHVTSKPEVDDGSLQLPFAYYIDGNPDDGFFHSPFEKRKGFAAGQLLATMRHDHDGRGCLLFVALRSPLGSRMLCAR
jgi:hypothetical protein